MRWIVALLCLVATTVATADPANFDSDLVVNLANALGKKASERIPNFPKEIAAGETRLYVSTGGRTAVILAVTKDGDGARLGRALERAVDRMGLGATEVVYRTGEDLTTARTTVQGEATGFGSSRIRLDLGALTDSLQRDGFTPTPVLFSRAHAVVSGAPVPAGRNTYDLRGSPKAEIVASGSVSLPQAILTTGILGLPILAAFGGIVGMLALARAKGPRGERRERSQRLVFWPAVIGGLVSFPLIVTFGVRSYMAAGLDVLFAVSNPVDVLHLPFAGLLVVPLAWAVHRAAVRRVYGLSARERAFAALRTPQIEAARKRFFGVVLPLGLVALGVGLYFVSEDRSPQGLLALVLRAVIPIGIILWFITGLGDVPTGTADEALDHRARQLAERMGVPARPTGVAEGLASQAMIGCVRGVQGPLVTERAKREGAPGEIDFLIAHRLLNMRPLWFAPFATVMVLLIGIVIVNFALSVYALATLPLLAWAAFHRARAWEKRRCEDADRRVVEATGDVASAVGAILKEGDLAESAWERAAIERRLARLLQAAEAEGLETSRARLLADAYRVAEGPNEEMVALRH